MQIEQKILTFKDKISWEEMKTSLKWTNDKLQQAQDVLREKLSRIDPLEARPHLKILAENGILTLRDIMESPGIAQLKVQDHPKRAHEVFSREAQLARKYIDDEGGVAVVQKARKSLGEDAYILGLTSFWDVYERARALTGRILQQYNVAPIPKFFVLETEEEVVRLGEELLQEILSPQPMYVWEMELGRKYLDTKVRHIITCHRLWDQRGKKEGKEPLESELILVLQPHQIEIDMEKCEWEWKCLVRILLNDRVKRRFFLKIDSKPHAVDDINFNFEVFSISSKFQADLTAGRLSEDLRRELQKYGISLEEASIREITQTQWEIKANPKVLIVQGENTLYVYKLFKDLDRSQVNRTLRLQILACGLFRLTEPGRAIQEHDIYKIWMEELSDVGGVTFLGKDCPIEDICKQPRYNTEIDDLRKAFARIIEQNWKELEDRPEQKEVKERLGERDIVKYGVIPQSPYYTKGPLTILDEQTFRERFPDIDPWK